MIRLGSLAGYPFEGPRVLGGWTPPATAAVYAVVYKPDPDTKPTDRANLSEETESRYRVNFQWTHRMLDG